MSCVAWDGRTLAADRQETLGEIKYQGKKIHRFTHGVCATVGDTARGRAYVQWYRDGMDGPPPAKVEDDEYAVLIYVKGRSCYSMYANGISIKVEGPYMAWGSGGPVALGAMAAGKNAREAVAISIKHCPGCGFGVTAYDIKEDDNE